jgi:hypothetical protein
VVGLSRSGGETASSGVTAGARQSALVLESGHVSLANALTVVAGQPISAGTVAELAPNTCLRSGSQVRLCSQRGAKLRLPAQGAPWNIELESGGVKAELHDLPGFSMRTLHGSAAVVGTIFSMELDASRTFTTVIVERGRVQVKNQRAGEQALVWAYQQARLGEALEVSGRGLEPPEPVPVAPLIAEVPDASPAPGVAPPASAKGKTAADLLEEAREQRGARHYAQAAQLYRRLVQQHPESAEARAALVSLGQLELGQLGQPEAALRSFQSYLARPGQLRQEAEHGVISALQRLGRKTDERRAIEAFLARYPKSTQAGPLSERLKQL